MPFSKRARLVRPLGLSLDGLPEQEAAIWIDLLRSGWRSHPKALPLQIVGLSMMALLISKSDLPMVLWLPPWACMLAVCLGVILLAFRFQRVQLDAQSYPLWRRWLLGWRLLHAVAGGVLCALLYGGLPAPWQLPLLTTVVVFTYGMTFYAIEDFGLAMIGTAPIVLSLLVALLWRGGAGDGYIAVLLVAASVNGWLAGRGISRRLFDAARTRQRNEVLVQELAREVAEVRRAKGEADQANREKSEFFAAASHDLRQPLYSLQLLSDHLRQQLTSSDQMQVADKLGAALTSMRQLFERMFDIARLESRKVAYHPRAVPVRDLFTSLGHEFELACREKGLGWSVHPTDDWLWTDPVLAQRMLRNLLENAVRYTTHGEVRLRARRRGGTIHCQVWDTGLGISRQDQAKVFNDYFQVQNTARRSQDGLGLGLGVVRRLVALTGTGIRLRSRLGRGSCFDIAFQASPAGAASAGAAADAFDALEQDADVPAEQPCVLVLEDQAHVLEAVVTILNHSGYLALGGEDALSVLKAAADRRLWPCAALCDYRLSHGYSGLDAIAQLRHELGEDFPILLVTGDLGVPLQAQAESLGIRILHKPLDRAQLLQALREATQGA